MKNIKTKFLFALLALSFLITFLPQQAKAQINSHWGNHEPGGTGNTPPNGQEFIRQDPIPESLKNITVYSSNNKNISLHVEFPDAFDYELSYGPDGKEYRRYKADSRYQILSNPGQPEILSRVVWLQVPYDAKYIKVQNTQLSIKEKNEESVIIYPRPYIVFKENKEKGIPIEKEQFYIDDEFYQKDSWNPEEDAVIMQETYKHGMHQIQVAIPVMHYNPKQNMLVELKAVSLDIYYQSESSENRLSNIDTSSDPFHKIFIDTIVNYAYKKASPNLTHNKSGVIEIPLEELDNPGWAYQHNFYPDYLVIVAKEFKQSDSLMQWANHRSAYGTGHKVAIAYTDEIYQKYTSETTEKKIKSFIQMVYDSWRPISPAPYIKLQYLLLIGDADYSHDDKDWFVPTWRTSDPGILMGNAGDNDYAWLEGKENDYTNDVLLGRLPTQTENELKIMIKKIIDFENNIPSAENHYGTRILWIAGDSGYRYIFPENLVRNLVVNTPLRHQGPFEMEEYDCNYEGGLNPFGYDTNKITDFLNVKGALFVSYQGHGEPSLANPDWTGWNPGVTVNNLSNADKMPLLVMSHACSTARFDYSDPYHENMPFSSYGEDWIKKEDRGAICFWGATRQAFSSTWSRHEDFYKSLIQDKNRNIGVILDIIRSSFPSNFFFINPPIDIDHLHHKIFSLLGDPGITFHGHFKPSTKIDLAIEDTRSATNPITLGHKINVYSDVINNHPDNVDEVTYGLFSVNHGDLNLLPETIKNVNLSPYDPKTITTEWYYSGECSIHFMPWIDPFNSIEERSEFNNHINSLRRYYPIHVNQSHIGENYGTKINPYKKLSSAIEHADENDLIGEYHREELVWIPIKLYNGVYGDGSQLTSNKAIFLNGIGESEHTIIYDSLSLTGRTFYIKDITFDGRKTSHPSLSYLHFNKLNNNKNSMSSKRILRCIFKENNGYSINTDDSIEFENSQFFNNYGVLQLDENSINNDFLAISFSNSTIFQNEKNLNLEKAPQENNSHVLRIHNSIFWENGPSLFPENFSSDNTRIKINYSDVDDYLLLNNMYPNFDPEGNIIENPEFFNPSNFDFHLKPNSPCIDSGSAGHDPDGTRSDMGVYGGYNAIIRPIRITSPIHGETLQYQPQAQTSFEYNLNINWKAYKLNPDDLVNIKIHHMKYEIAYPDKGNNTPHYSGVRVIDLDVLVENSQTYLATIEQEIPTQSYWLTITNNENSEEYEKINFKITSESSSIKSNR